MEPALIIDGVSKRFGLVQALVEVGFTVPRGSVFGLLGPNGAGKTTLFSLVAGFLRTDAGRIQVLGQDLVRGLPRRLLGRIGVLPQDAAFQSDLPIVDQVVYFGRLLGLTPVQARAQAAAAMERVGLAEVLDRRAAHLSHGMYKRLGLAQAFLGHPELILLDEPTAGLDPDNAEAVRRLIRELTHRAATVVISSHNLAEMQELCDGVAILKQGRIVSCGAVRDLLAASHRVEFTLAQALDDTARNDLGRLPGVAGLEITGPAAYAIRIDVGPWQDDPDRFVAALMRLLVERQAILRSLSTGSSLVEHFLEVTR